MLFAGSSPMEQTMYTGLATQLHWARLRCAARVVVLALAGMLGPGLANAESVRAVFELVTNDPDHVGSGTLAGLIGFQEPYLFSVVIDLDAPPVATNGTTLADYEYDGGSLDVGGLSIPLSRTTVMVRDDHGGPPADSYFAAELETPDPFELNGGVSLFDLGSGGLDGITDLGPLPPDPAEFLSPSGSMTLLELDAMGTVVGSIQLTGDLVAVTVPEPSISALAWAAGLALLGAAARRRRLARGPDSLRPGGR